MIAAIKSAPLGRVDRKIALLRYVERLPLPDIAAQTHYSRTAIGYRLKGIDKMLDRQNALLTTVMSQQTDTILNRVNPRPIPAYQVANPNVGVNCCGCC